MATSRDVVVIGGGHNGLVAAAYLAKAGLDVTVCERRPVVGGAAVSEHPFGPDYTVTSLSYVVSLLPPDLVTDLGLTRHGYHVFPQGPYFAPRADGRYLRLPDDPAQRHAEIAKFSAADADAYPRYEAHLAALGQVLGPLLDEVPPRLGSRRPLDLWRQGLLLRHLRGLDERGVVDVTRLLTGSIADLIEEYFSSDAMLGLLSVSGVIGTWAGPRSAGTAYVMLHHHIGGVDGQAGAWGFPRGGMGGVTSALAAAARSFGAEIRTGAPVGEIRTRDGRVAGVTLASGEEIDAATVITTAHPQISFLELLDPAALPGDFVADIRRWQTRSGTVKINLALDRLPVFTSHPAPDPQIHGGTIVLAESLDDIETAFQQAVAGAAVGPAVRGYLHPQRVRRLARAPRPARHVDVHPVGAARLGRRAARGGAGRLRRPGHGPDGAGRARVHQLGAAPAGDRPAPDAGGVRPGRRQHLPRRAQPGADVPRPSRGRLRGPAHPGDRAVPGGIGHPRRRRGHRHPGPQRGAPGPGRPPRRPAPRPGGPAEGTGRRARLHRPPGPPLTRRR